MVFEAPNFNQSESKWFMNFFAAFFSVILLLSLVSCGGGRVDVSDHRPVAPLPLQNDTEATISAINQGRVPLEEGLRNLGQTLRELPPDDDPSLYDEATGAPQLPAPPEGQEILVQGAEPENRVVPASSGSGQSSQRRIEDLASALTHIRRGEPVSNLAILLGIDAFTDSGENTTNHLRVCELFEALAAHPDAVPAATDSFLLRYYVIHNHRAEHENQRLPFHAAARRYFSNRMATRLREAIRTYSPEILTLVPSLFPETPATHPGFCRGGESDFDLNQASESAAYRQALRRLYLMNESRVSLNLGSQAAQLLREYSWLYLLLSLNDRSADRWFLRNFNLLTYFADLRHPLSIKAQELYRHYLRIWRRQTNEDRILSVRHLRNAIYHGKSASLQLQDAMRTLASSDTLTDVVAGSLETMDEVNALFDLNPTHYPGLSPRAWSDLLSMRIRDMLRPFRTTLTQYNLRNSLSYSFQSLSRHAEHPYTQIYFNRALIELGWAGEMRERREALIANENKIAAADRAIETFRARVVGLNGLDAPRAQQCAPWDHLPEHITATFEDIAPAGDFRRDATADELIRMRCFQWGLYRVEILRSFLEEDTARDASHSILSRGITNEADPRIDLYRRIRTEVEQAIVYGYKEIMERRDAFTQARAVLSCVQTNRVSPLLFSLCHFRREELADRQPQDNVRNVIDFSHEDIELDPGIYEVESSVELRVRSLLFHPLALIRVRQGLPELRPTIRIVSSVVYDPWIDVSGEAGVNQGSLNPADLGTRPHVDNHAWCQLASSDGRAAVRTVLPNQGYQYDVLSECMGPSATHDCSEDIALGGEFHKEDVRYCSAEVGQTTGRAPGNPLQSAPGNAAGNIILTLRRVPEFRGMPLLVALGGDGAAGVRGVNSPNCSHPTNANASYNPPEQASLVALFGAGILTDRLGENGWALLRRSSPTIQTQGLGDFGYEVAQTMFRNRSIPTTPIHVDAGQGGRGGNSGNGGSISINVDYEDSPHIQIQNLQMQTIFLAPGRPGAGGEFGACHPPQQSESAGRGPLGSVGSVSGFRISRE